MSLIKTPLLQKPKLMIKRGGLLICPLFSDPKKLISALKIVKKISEGSYPGPSIFPLKGGVINMGGVFNKRYKVGMLFSMKYLFSGEKIKSAPHTLIKSWLIPNFFWKNRFLHVSLRRGRFLLHKNLWSWLSPSWKYFLRPLAPKSMFYRRILKNWCPFMMDFEKCLILW